MPDTGADLVARLDRPDGLAGLADVAVKRIQSGAGSLGDLGAALVERTTALSEQAAELTERRDRLAYTRDAVLHALALTPGRDNIRLLLRLVAPGPRVGDPRVGGRRAGDRDGLIAAMLAQGQSPEDLELVFSGAEPASEELRNCLVQELVLRRRSPRTAGWVPHPEHRLARLPRALTRLEREPVLVDYSVMGHSREFGADRVEPWSREGWGLPPWTPPPPGPATPAEVAARPVPTATETTTWTDETAIGQAFGVWRSGWRLQEVRVYRLDRRPAAEELIDLLLSLRLISFRGRTDPRAAVVDPLTPAAAWDLLYDAAARAGGDDRQGADHRLDVWTSLAGLVGRPGDSPPGEIEPLAEACSWYHFAATGDWFEGRHSAIGLLALGPELGRLALVTGIFSW